MAVENGGISEEKQSNKSIASQFVAGIGLYLMLIDLVLSLSFSTIVIPALLHNNGSMSFTEEQASWFGSVYLIAQPFGSLISGVLLEPLGRKKSLLIVNVPHIIAWIAMAFSPNIEFLFFANILHGFGTGFSEAPLVTYLGEIGHPTIRGKLITTGQCFANAGTFLAYFFGSLMVWRNAALVSLTIPILSFISIIFVPEVPVWLITKGRLEESLKSLCWIRGWTNPESVQKEFDELLIYQKNSMKCEDCGELKCVHKLPGFKNKLKRMYADLSRKEMLRPLCLIMFGFFCQQASGILPLRPNMINIYKCFGFTIDVYLATVITGGLGVLSTIILVLLMGKLGKRLLFLYSLLSCAFCTFSLGMYAFLYVDHKTSSYDLTSIIPDATHYSWFPMTIFVIFNLVSAGAINLPWIIICEVFPLRGRGVACGITAATAYILAAIANKTYYNLEKTLGIYGVFWFYCILSIIGISILYLFMPETEGKSLEEIETNFNGDHLKIIPNNYFIRKMGETLKNVKYGKNQKNTNTNQDSAKVNNGFECPDSDITKF